MIQHRALGFVVVMLTPILVRFAIISDYVVRYEYYATVLCENQDKPELSCNGKCAMMQNLQEAENQDQPQAPSFPQIKLHEMPFDLQPESQTRWVTGVQTRHATFPIAIKIPRPFIGVKGKPPAAYVS